MAVSPPDSLEEAFVGKERGGAAKDEDVFGCGEDVAQGERGSGQEDDDEGMTADVLLMLIGIFGENLCRDSRSSGAMTVVSRVG